MTDLYELRDHMHSNVKGILNRATVNAQRMRHSEVGNAHLLLGILALGNNDRLSPIPHILRNCGVDFERLHKMLDDDRTLRSASIGITPQLDDDAMKTLREASEIAQRRLQRPSNHYSILTADLLEALLKSDDPKIDQALQRMRVQKSEIIRRANIRMDDRVEAGFNQRHLRALN